MARTSAPAAHKASVKCEPINPPAPVTKTFFRSKMWPFFPSCWDSGGVYQQAEGFAKVEDVDPIARDAAKNSWKFRF